jgi:Zn-dependent alcohol dehydrogenase
MRAAVLREQGTTPKVEELTLPPVLEPGQVRVGVRVAGICGAQIREISGAKGPDPYLPHLLGHEGSGVVESVGVGVTTVKPGDRVVAHWRKGSGIEAPPPIYTDAEGHPVGAGLCAVWAEQAVVSENRLTPTPTYMAFDKAALLGCGVTTGFGVVVHEARLQPGESILVAGVGGVGLSVVQAAQMVSAHPIVAYDQSDARLRLASKVGADLGFTPEHARQVADTVGPGVDVFVDCTGVPEVIDWGHLLVRPGGRTILVGQPEQGLAVTFHGMSRHYCGKTLLDSQGGLTEPDRDIPRLVTLWEFGKLDLTSLLGRRWDLDRLDDALTYHQAGNAGRSLLVM